MLQTVQYAQNERCVGFSAMVVISNLRVEHILITFVPRILDTLHVCLISFAMYWYCITNFANVQASQQLIWYVSVLS